MQAIILMKHKRNLFVFLSCFLIIPVFYVSYDVLASFMQSYPLRSTNQSQEWRYDFFLTHYQNDASQVYSLYDPKSAQELAYFLLKGAIHKGLSEQKQKQLNHYAYQILMDLQKYYPHDSILTLRNVSWLWQQKQFMQAYQVLNRSYAIAPCYEAAMNYRVILKKQLRLFVPDKTLYDFKKKLCFVPFMPNKE
ncbi:MAG: hypothetical protein ACJARD_000894 [Alphaproteobacteria bacterium]|jgi:hypothetical protein